MRPLTVVTYAGSRWRQVKQNLNARLSTSVGGSLFPLNRQWTLNRLKKKPPLFSAHRLRALQPHNFTSSCIQKHTRYTLNLMNECPQTKIQSNPTLGQKWQAFRLHAIWRRSFPSHRLKKQTNFFAVSDPARLFLKPFLLPGVTFPL